MYNKGIKTFEEFLENPFLGENIGNAIDIEFMLSLSKPAQNIIRYMVKKKTCLEDKFLFDVDDFNKFSGYKSRAVYLKGVIDLIMKNVLAKTKLPHLYWVNKGILDKSSLISVM
ncbi:MAG: hypothetical protein NMK33_06150 (plasmid) [Candidatus Cardinium sp.]|uniref:hypothetical protein n=1 Tax=Cardinium endosymbiont of Dermatophagoides farinae TaxID=2597823 RepID=UPI0011839A90|nr:hypothetical protein [Cardinium endosymbiont of Dermatophagoides farinae]TSJ80091.1 hypothetical protein FPG78_06385 [Cardinium endosymbiont of Dermatophagoides farinae]TSJ80115.1 hypothetical protein FPG78_06535 [Cardinium endosymbiont of Dermatophagoides farinae]UWW97562.1 MAG: hypothetical protein NMK33_06460 [Candidatus Cardinium sp.]UWW97629.1 MAG: hypothetical protein NMK33_06150 [Candidatus Cardinium sp.]